MLAIQSDFAKYHCLNAQRKAGFQTPGNFFTHPVVNYPTILLDHIDNDKNNCNIKHENLFSNNSLLLRDVGSISNLEGQGGTF